MHHEVGGVWGDGGGGPNQAPRLGPLGVPWVPPGGVWPGQLLEVPGGQMLSAAGQPLTSGPAGPRAMGPTFPSLSETSVFSAAKFRRL